ncbi:MAG TPA: hypothetical protein PLM26_13120, partial [Saprospiraceae bacterium]|nr:hypothetical protein [Saprospiraceae bacterium]
MNFPKITFKNIIKTSIEVVSLRELTHRRSFCLHLFLTGLLLTLSILQSNAQSNCVSGCNENAYLYSTVPNTLEYDNMVALFHTTMIKEANGDFKIWGQAAASNGTGNVLSPTVVKPSNGYSYSGTPLKMTGGSTGAASAATQMALLTTEGLYIWGTTNHLVSTNIKNSTAIGTSPVSIGTSGVSNGTNPNYAKGLPYGVDPGQVKMLFGSYRTLAIVTCTGEVWVLSYNGNKNGDGTGTSGDNNYVWHKVFTSTTNNGSTKGAELSNVVAVRGTPNALFALTADGKLYTWGSGTYINNGAAANRTYATEIDISALSPAVTPKMIGMTQNEANQSYYLLATDGRLFTMGNNGQRQLGDFTTTNRNTWVQAKKSSASGSEFDDIVWISPNEHDDYGIAAINVLKSSDKKLWAWGNNDGNMIGGATNGSNYDPMEMPGTGTGPNDMKVTDNIVAVETGGHITLNLKECSQKYGYVGHKTNGSMGDGTSGSGNPNTYSYSTAVVVVCGAAVAPAIVDNMETCPGTTVNLYDAQLAAAPPGYEIKWYTDEAGTVEVDDPLTAGAGTYYAFYESISGGVKQCPEVKTVLTVSYLQPDDPSCAFDINGNVFNDLNGLNDGIVNGTGTDAGGNLYVVLVDKNNIVINVATVANDGTYAFTSIPKGEYTLVLSTSNPNNGDPAPSPSLPAGWINMGENIGSGSGDDGTPDGMISIDGSNGNITNANFGIFQMSPSIELKKSGSYTDKNGDGMASVGDEIHYTFTVTNTGNVALTNITVSDPKVMVNGGPVNLATGVSDNSSFTATYVITQADIDNGGIYNTATATGKDPIGDDVSGDSQDPDPLNPSDPNYDPNCPDCTYTPISQTPAISITKDGAYDAGTGEITYTFVVTNTGNVSLSNVAVTDPLLGGSWSHSIGSLAVGEIVPFTVTYTVTQADINANGVYNLATVTGKTPDGSDISEDSEDPTPLDPTDSNYDPNCPNCTFVPISWAEIAANDDNFGGINGADGGTTPSVLDNDELNGSPVDPSDVTLTPGTPSDPALSMNPDGTVEIAPGTPAGTYTYPYTICEIANPSNCDNATVTVVVGAPEIVANDDNFGGINGADGGTTPSVLDNDELNGSPVNPSDVTLTPGTPSDPALSMNPDGTIEIAPGTPAGTYTYPYTICEGVNPSNCDDATVTVVVGAPEIVANDD